MLPRRPAAIPGIRVTLFGSTKNVLRSSIPFMHFHGVHGYFCTRGWLQLHTPNLSFTTTTTTTQVTATISSADILPPLLNPCSTSLLLFLKTFTDVTRGRLDLMIRNEKHRSRDSIVVRASRVIESL